MFGIFKKKPSMSESISACAVLAEKANISAVLEDGNYKGFLIILDQSTSSVVEFFKFREALTFFMTQIESRISSRQFHDPGNAPDINYIRESTGWEPNMDVGRVVVGSDYQPLFNWQP